MSDLVSAFDFANVTFPSYLPQKSQKSRHAGPSPPTPHSSPLTHTSPEPQPDLSLPAIPTATLPSKDSKTGAWNGYATCEATYASPRPPVPYSNQTAANTLTYEQGFKSVRGALTEGRYLTFEMNGFALQNSGAGTLVAGPASFAHSDVAQRFVVQQVVAGGTQFLVKSAVDGEWVTSVGTLTKEKGQAATFVVTDLGNFDEGEGGDGEGGGSVCAVQRDV